MGTAATGIFAVLLLTSTLALPSRRLRGVPLAATSNFVGEGTNELATAILQGYVDLESNLAFSPLGYTALLAVLAEGARGETRDQLVNALHLPDDPQATRMAYKTVLERLSEKKSENRPEFRNWFYVYKNFTVEPDYKTILQESYLTELKDVDRFYKDAVMEEAVSMKAPEPAQIAGDVLVSEENINEMKLDKLKDAVKVDDSAVPEKLTHDSMAPGKLTDNAMAPEKLSDESTIPEKSGDTIVSEKTEEIVVPEKNDNADKIPEKIEDPMPSFESEEIMQLSDEEGLTKPSKNGPLKIAFPIPFPEKLKLRKMNDEREASPSGAVMTMQEEMLENKKEEEKTDGEKKVENMEEIKYGTIEAKQKDKTKEKESMNEKTEIPDEDTKEEKNEEIKDGMKNDKIKKDDKMEVIKEKNDKMEAMKDDKIEVMKDDKLEAMKGDSMEAIKDDKMEATKEDKIELIKDDKMESMKDDKMESMKDDKMELMKGDKTEPMKVDKIQSTKDEKMESMKDDKLESMKDDIMESMKDEKTESIKDEKMEAMKDEKTESINNDKKEAMKDDKMESMKDEKMESMKDDKMEATKNDKLEATKDENVDSLMEAMKDDNMEAMKEEMVTDEKRKNDKKGSMAEGIKDDMIKDEIKSEEVIMEDKDKKDEMITGVVEKTNVDHMKKKEVMLTMERKARHLDLRRLSRGSLLSDDVTSSLSGNNIVRKDTKSEVVTQILVFNGLYFRGAWANPFVRQKQDSFYKSDSEKSTVTMMNTQGNYRAGSVPELDSVAIELPYKGGRYSLLLLIPNSRTGLSQLTSDLAGYSLRNVQKHLQLHEVEVSLPSFEIHTTTKPVEALNKFGVSDVFSKEKADLSGISKDSGLFVEELVQLVTVKVDNDSSSYNHIAVGNPSTRSGLFKVVADRPFLYFVRDTEDNLIVVAGTKTSELLDVSWNKVQELGEISGSYGGEYEDSLLGYSTMQSCRSRSTFQGCVLPPSSP